MQKGGRVRNKNKQTINFPQKRLLGYHILSKNIEVSIMYCRCICDLFTIGHIFYRSYYKLKIKMFLLTKKGFDFMINSQQNKLEKNLLAFQTG